MTVSSIVARPAQHQDRPHRPARADGNRNGTARCLHQRTAGRTGRLCRVIGLAHLGRGQQGQRATFESVSGNHVDLTEQAMT